MKFIQTSDFDEYGLPKIKEKSGGQASRRRKSANSGMWIEPDHSEKRTKPWRKGKKSPKR
jgi:hypothetical protein